MTALYPDLQGKTALITGCSSGIGQSQCEFLLKQGCRVIGIDRSDCDITDVAFQFMQADLTDVQTLDAILKHMPLCDVVCNTAGILDDYQPSLKTSINLWRQVLDTNLQSMFLVCNELIHKSLLAHKALSIVNMASIAGFMASGGGAAYTASKHAIIGYTKQLNFDYGQWQIRANCIAPGAVITQMTQLDFQDQTAQLVADQTVVGRYATPAEIAELTLFLASQSSNYIYGAVIPIDGGFSLGKVIDNKAN
ncbi:3-oxoacyl-ACP reductase [Bombilactobacillus folatiphilus]|uniref:3-oxoacyl-ACP reductase n=1 Tax=Bombilactobacillus folatiphilus TaxID=2923362 RepID=A0ABY4PBH9_9LACO|nr:3-oxoacyl-ACP reductase [Bombilactobacillus folatiphilus]UQS82914.1 3-oxoacyl-ACP reductase [Bombilactobacillus folatiphilus]